MGIELCKQGINTQDNNLLLISQKPQKSDYQESDWPLNDTYIISHLKSINKQKQKPVKHRSKNLYFLGNWKEAMPEGQGLIYFPDNFLYIGIFQSGAPQGKGKFYSIEYQYEFEGIFHLGRANGEGYLISHKHKFTFNGSWSDSKPIKGVIKFNQSKTVIEIIDYAKCIATIYHDNGTQYTGQIDQKNLLPQGNGTATFINSNRYIGWWSNGMMHGKGIYQWRDGTDDPKVLSTYDGDYQFGKKHGYGKFTYNSGNYYQGYWVEGKMEGKGKWTDILGNSIEGIWKDSQYIERYEMKNEQNYNGQKKDSPIKQNELL